MALFTTAKAWEQPKCPSTDERIYVVYIHNVHFYSVIKKNGIMPFAPTWMELEIITPSEINKKEKEKCHMMSLICRI